MRGGFPVSGAIRALLNASGGRAWHIAADYVKIPQGWSRSNERSNNIAITEGGSSVRRFNFNRAGLAWGISVLGIAGCSNVPGRNAEPVRSISLLVQASFPAANAGRPDAARVEHLASARVRASRPSAPAGSRVERSRAYLVSDLGEARDLTGDPIVPPPAQARRPLPDLGETIARDLQEFPGVFWEDAKQVYSDRANLVILGLTYGASLTLQATDVDDTVENSFRTHRTFKDDWRDAFGALGNPGLHFGVAGIFYLVGHQQQDDRTYEVSTKLFRALALTGATVILGKTATWDDVPNGEFGSFPSGHTASTFVFASVLHEEYGPWVGIPLYGLGALVGYTRLEDEEHYFSDVVMGGVLGLVVGHSIARDGEPLEVAGGQIVPYADPAGGSTGILWVYAIR
ncbi:MAG: hypothetical protein FLDDKLPJ_03068 [Phycisphaerae bacterium]|nr:hypothetical protein [Phycisphaerae bacterium]